MQLNEEAREEVLKRYAFSQLHIKPGTEDAEHISISSFDSDDDDDT